MEEINNNKNKINIYISFNINAKNKQAYFNNNKKMYGNETYNINKGLPYFNKK